MRKYKIIMLLAVNVLLLVSCSKATKGEAEKDTVNLENTVVQHTVPDLSGENFDSTLQMQLMKDGYILSVKTEYHDTVPVGCIIEQTPAGNTVTSEKEVALKLTISAGKKKETLTEDLDASETPGTEVPESDYVSTIIKYNSPRWIISPEFSFDKLSTFGKTGYSICKKNNKYSVIDINGKTVLDNYDDLFYCPEHGLSSNSISKKTQLLNDLTLSPDCGYRSFNSTQNIYVYDDSRMRVYLTGYSGGVFKIVDITDTEFFRTNEQYIAVLYNCDADLLMYDGIGMKSLDDIFKAEHTEMKYGVIDSNFRAITEFVYDEISDGNDCYILKQNGKYGYVGTDGKIYYYPCIFEEANTAYMGAAWVKYNGKWGTIVF